MFKNNISLNDKYLSLVVYFTKTKTNTFKK